MQSIHLMKIKPNVKIIGRILPIGMILCSLTSFGSENLTNLTVEKRPNPLGLVVSSPRFGWQITSDDKNVFQTSYRILVSSSIDNLNGNSGEVWDSGVNFSDSSQWIEYGGPQLQPNTVYHWKTIVTTNKSKTPIEATGTWSTGLLSDGNWSGKWIGLNGLAPNDTLTRHSVVTPRYLRKEFTTGKEIKRATIHVSGLGNYILNINGERIGNDVLTPLPTDYAKRIAYDTYDVTDIIGKNNAIGVVVAGGHFTGMVQNFQTNVRTSYGLPRLKLNLIMEYKDGAQETISTDETWKLTTDGEIRNAAGYDGETYDANYNLGDWSNAGYDDSKWSIAQIMDTPSGKMHGALAPNMYIYKSDKPKEIRKIGNSYLLDFGTNEAGRIRLNIIAAKGDTVKIRHAELLDSTGNNLYTDNLRSAYATVKYVSDGVPSVYSPDFTFYGFRYAEIEGLDNLNMEDVSRDIIADRMNDEFSDITIYDINDNDIINHILDNARRGILSNYKGMPIDCPQRDERMPWLGDRTTGCFGESYMFDNHNLYSKWVKDICDSQRSNGMISDVSPAYWRLYNGNVTWSAALPFVCDMLYRQYGDIRPMQESFPNIKLFMSYLKDNKYDNGLITFDKYGDWCVPPESPELVHSKDSKRITDGSLISTAYYIYLCRMMSKYADIIGGLDDDVQYFKAEADKSTKAFNDTFLSDGQYSNGTVTANLLPLAIGLVSTDDTPGVHENLLNTIIDVNDSHISTGVIGIQWLMRYLSDSGNGNLAYKIATQEDYPGWGYMVKNGATTIWELWNGNTANPSMNSCNHVMLLGDLLIWCYEYLGGVRPSEDGFKKITFKPDYSIEFMGGADVKHNTPYGPFMAKWNRNGKQFELDVTVPPNVTADIHFPSGRIQQIGSGEYKFKE